MAEESAAALLRRRRTRSEVRRGYILLALRTALLAALAYLLLTRVFLVARAGGMEMFPAVRDGDVLIAFRLENDCARGDIVVYSYEGKRCVGRVAARETDVVVLSEDDTLLVNGTVQTGDVFYPTYPDDALSYPFTVPDGCLFLLGDSRTQATDSRTQGAIPLAGVQGKVIALIRRRGL